MTARSRIANAALTTGMLAAAIFAANVGLSIGSALVGCNGTLTPPSGPDTPYPCGLRGVSCGDGMCCPEDHVCGHDRSFSRCEPGYCCYDGPTWPGASADAGSDTHSPTRQTRAR
jgi:hypothetical protein